MHSALKPRAVFLMVGVNDINPTGAAAPFGGVKESGLGREGGQEVILEYLDSGRGDVLGTPYFQALRKLGITGQYRKGDFALIRKRLDVFDFELTSEQLAAIDALDTGVRGGPEPEVITLESFGRAIPEA